MSLRRSDFYFGILSILFLFALALSIASCGPVKPPQPWPTPTPTPVPTPTPTPTPPPQFSCPARVDKINVALRQLARTIVDATPQTCDRDWCAANGFPGQVCCPLGGEGGAQRPFCETKLGPYSWAVNAQLCVRGGVDLQGGGCFMNNGNPLQVVILPATSGLLVQICPDAVNTPPSACGLVTLP